MSTAVITRAAGASESTLAGRPKYVVVGSAAIATGKVAVAPRVTDDEVEAIRRRVREQGR